MKGQTHLMGAAALVVPVAAIAGSPYLVVVGMIAGLAPDLDASDAMLKHWSFNLGSRKSGFKVKPFFFISLIANIFFKHRGFLHSAWALIIFSIVALLLSYIFGLAGCWGFTAAIFLGYLSHLILDSMTPSGIPLWGKEKLHVLPEKLRIKTGSYMENLFLAVFALVVLYYLSLSVVNL